MRNKSVMSKSPSTHTSLAPSLLVSMPQLNDPNFHKTVILLCEHDAEGAFGLVMNRQTQTPASEVVRLSPPVDCDNGWELWVGGPVEPERGWILMGTEPSNVGSIRVCDGVYLSTSPVLLRRFPRATTAAADASPHRVCRLGHGSTRCRVGRVSLADDGR